MRKAGTNKMGSNPETTRTCAFCIREHHFQLLLTILQTGKIDLS